jgi:hypothetical protein
LPKLKDGKESLGSVGVYHQAVRESPTLTQQEPGKKLIRNEIIEQREKIG